MQNRSNFLNYESITLDSVRLINIIQAQKFSTHLKRKEYLHGVIEFCFGKMKLNFFQLHMKERKVHFQIIDLSSLSLPFQPSSTISKWWMIFVTNSLNNNKWTQISLKVLPRSTFETLLKKKLSQDIDKQHGKVRNLKI